MWSIKDCKAVARQHVTMQHKPVVFVVCKKKRREVKRRSQKIIWWGKCGQNAVEYKERLWARYEQFSEEAEGLEE